MARFVVSALLSAERQIIWQFRLLRKDRWLSLFWPAWTPRWKWTKSGLFFALQLAMTIVAALWVAAWPHVQLERQVVSLLAEDFSWSK